MDKIYIDIDGSNAAFYKRTSIKKAKFSNLEIIKNYSDILIGSDIRENLTQSPKEVKVNV